MFDRDLSVAYERSNDVLNEFDIGEAQFQVEEIVDIVSEKVGCDISISECSFSELSTGIKKCGAMMCTSVEQDGKRNAEIVLNSDNDIAFRRFSLMHELGHLMTANENDLFAEVEDVKRKYVVSTHIDYKITSIPAKKYKTVPKLFKEQLANVFALRVLMPASVFYDKLIELDRISNVAKYFGVTEDAVISRIMLVK